MRLFIAAELGDALVAGLAKELERLSPTAPKARWVRPENVHLTLSFLGEVGPDRVPALERVVREIAARHPVISLEVRGGGAFGSPRRPHVLWLGLRGNLAALEALHADLKAALAPLGFVPEDREFRPHLTLGRSRDPRGEPTLAACAEALRDVDLGSLRISELVLFESHLSGKGPRYTARVRAPLQGG